MDTNTVNIQDRTYHKNITVVPRAATDEQGREYYEFELSNELPDQHRTIFRMDGGKISDFNAEPIVTYGHPSFDSTDPDDVIGTGPAYFENGKLIGRFYPEEGDDNPKAKKVVAKIKQGLIRSASIVAEIEHHTRGMKEKGEDNNLVYFRNWNLLMWGIVMKGSNPKAKLRTHSRAMEFFETADPAIETTDTITSDNLELESLLTEQRLRLMKMDIDSSTAAQ